MKVVDKKKGITTEMCFDSVPTKGRPIKQLNEAGKEMVRKLAAVMCTEEEIASVLGVTVEVLHNRLFTMLFWKHIKTGKRKERQVCGGHSLNSPRKTQTWLFGLGSNTSGREIQLKRRAVASV